MPSLKKMRDIRKQQRLAAGKVSPLSPEKKPVKKPKKTMTEKEKRAKVRTEAGRAPQQTVKPKRGGIRKAAKDTQKAAAKKAAVKTPKTKTSAKAKVKPPTSKVAGVGRGLLGRAMGWAAVPYLALESVAPVFRHLFPKTEAWKSTPKLRAAQKRTTAAIEKMGKKQTPSQQIHGGGAPYVGQQTDPGISLRGLKKAKKAVSPLEETGPVTAAKTTPEVKKNKFTASGVKISTAFREPSMEKRHYTPEVYIKTRTTDTPPKRVKKAKVKTSKSKVPVAVVGRHMYETITKKAESEVPTKKAVDSPGPPPPTPKSVSREKQRRDFAAYNKPGSKLGMKMDDILRGAFSFMGALPKSTAKDKWKNK